MIRPRVLQFPGGVAGKTGPLSRGYWPAFLRGVLS
jgi:hypothetical protein